VSSHFEFVTFYVYLCVKRAKSMSFLRDYWYLISCLGQILV